MRLSDHTSIGLLTKTYPPELVDAVVASTGRTQLRHRLLPARVVVYYVMALSLYSQASYEEVMRFLVQGLSWLTHWHKGWQVPTKAAIFKSRQRLGVEPMQELFRTTARPLASSETQGAWYRGWRVMALDGSCLDVSQRFEDGSYLADVYDSANRHRDHGMTVRVIEYMLDDPGRPGDMRYRLLTNTLEPARAPAQELAALYAQRWEFETTLDELKIHQRGPRVVLRSKFPDGVYQEAYDYLLTHYAIRALMHDAAVEAGLDPDRLSCLRSLRAVRRSTTSASSFSP